MLRGLGSGKGQAKGAASDLPVSQLWRDRDSKPAAFAAPGRLGLQPRDTIAGCGDAFRIAGSIVWVLGGVLSWAHLSTEVRMC